MNNSNLELPYPARKADHWGFINKNAEWVISPMYEAVLPFNSNGVALVIQKGSVRFVNLQGSTVGNNSPSAVCVEVDGNYSIAEYRRKWYVIDQFGNRLSETGYDAIYPFGKDRIAVMTKNNRSGFIKESGEVIIKPYYFDAISFYGGVAAVKTSRYWQLINLNCNYIGNICFEDVREFSNCGLAAAKIDNHYGYIDCRGEFVIPPIYKDVSDFYSGQIAWVRDEKGWRLINSSGAYLCNDWFDDYDDTAYIETEKFMVKHNHYWGVLQSNGRFAIKPYFPYPIRIITHGYFVEAEGGFRYLTVDGHETPIVVRSYVPNSGCHPIFCDGDSRNLDKFGYINTDTITVIEAKYTRANPFDDNGIAEVVLDGENYTINAQGEFVQSPKNTVVLFELSKKSGADVVVTTLKDKSICVGKHGIYEMIGNYNKPYRFILKAI